MDIYVNRVLNMKHIKAIGFDMDHTLVRYHSDKFEELTFYQSIKKLIKDKGYPAEIENFKFDFLKTIRGLVVDKNNGNILKVSLYNKIKTATHGTKELSYKEQIALYAGQNVDLSDPQFMSIDTNFSMAHTHLFSLLVDLKDSKPDLDLPPYVEMADDVTYAVDICHRDGTLKDIVVKNLDKYIILDPKAVEALERLRKYNKRLWIITNSDYKYTRALLDYTINPYLKDHKHWTELFEVTITLAFKPKFFTDKKIFLKVDPETGLMENFDAPIETGIFQGGYATKLQQDMKLAENEILYLGDHIYGDVMKLKKTCGWRTALVIEELDKEVQAFKSTKDISIEIDHLMDEKVAIEKKIDDLYAKEYEFGQDVDKQEVFAQFDKVEKLDKKIGTLIKTYEGHFNPFWGEVMRAGVEPSLLASQVERYACIYMTSVADLANYSPRTYFRPKKRKMAHEK
ncbi:MAG: 5'-nucleotidase [Halobacteriovoraceae bacterium]|nr:5'-nucleotidase [Halobacteriovoraceae bacterium]|tara:strand:- start:1752 stop:3119 length:1368 start_codon:yes stop_codon:yes gene_type:complete